MTDKHTIALLQQETEKSLAFFAAPPHALMKQYQMAADPIVPRFGTDIESYILCDGRNVYGRGNEIHVERFRDFDQVLKQRLNDEGLGADGRGRDGTAVEIQLRPQTVPDIYGAFLRARAITEEMTAEHGGKAYFGEGHWHVSLQMGGQNLYNSRDFTLYAVAGLLHFQRELPALFVKPHIAERSNSDNRHAGARSFGFRDYHMPLASVLLANGGRTIENRLAVHAPYQPVALTLAGLKHGIENSARSGGTIAAAKEYGRLSESEDILQGPGGYAGMLAQTRDNVARGDLIPVELGRSLLAGSIALYEEYLEWPRTKADYPADTVETIRQDIARLRASIPLP